MPPFTIFAYISRTTEYSGSLLASDGVTPVQLTSGDAVRFKIGRNDGSAPLLDLVSGEATDHGSTIAITSNGTSGESPTPATYQITLAQADIAEILSGDYDCELAIVDSADSNYIKSVQQGICHVMGTSGGNVGVS